jgi:hypothetical protein
VKIDRIEKDPKLVDIVIVTAEDGSQIRYRMDGGGVLRPGRVWQSGIFGPEGYTVTMFIPLPDGTPEILKVEVL